MLRIRISKWMIAAMIVAAPLAADDRYEKTMNGTVTYHGGRVTIDHGFGRVEVHTSNANQVSARATIRTSDAEIGRQVHFNVSNDGDGVTVRTVYPSIHSHGEDSFSYSVDLDVTIPERAPLHLRNRFGSIFATGLRAPAEIVNAQGSIDVRDIHGGRIENRFGSISLRDSDGDTTVSNANGSIKIEDVRGQLSVTNRFASVSVERVGGGLSVSATNGSVSVTDVKGPTSISDTFASVTVHGVGGPLAIADTNGNVTAVDVRGDLEIQTRFGLVKAEDIRGDLRVSNGNGGVTASGIAGSARVHTSFASVFLKGVDGSVEVENQNGAISVSGLRGRCNEVSLRTSYSPIKIALASNASYTLSARTSYGTINTDLPLTITSKSSSDMTQSMSGTIGDGGCKMELVTSNGSITITRE